MGIVVSNNKKIGLSKSRVAELSARTSFSKQEIKAWHENFRIDYPRGYLTVDTFERIYTNKFPHGDVSMFAKHMFRVYDFNGDSRITFPEFIVALSVSTRGTVRYIFYKISIILILVQDTH